MAKKISNQSNRPVAKRGVGYPAIGQTVVDQSGGPFTADNPDLLAIIKADGKV